MADQTTIYVYLLDEGTDVWRPVQAEVLENRLYRIISENEASDDEKWQFPTGTMVRCEKRVLSTGEALVAVEAL